MEQENMAIEITAPTPEEAIAKGLSDLGLGQDAVDIEILDEGKKALFRFTSRQARVRLTVKSSAQAGSSKDNGQIKKYDSQEEESFADLLEASEMDGDDDAAAYVKSVIRELLKHMGVSANVSVTCGQPVEDQLSTIKANIEGNDLSFLIGRKSETINALQYIVSLMVGNKMNHWVPVQIDVQNYRERRERELRKLARRLADQVITSGRMQFLEPMPANERRIIHMELRDHPLVTTESSGEEPFRKVKIKLK